MLAYVMRRVLTTLPTILVIVTATFFVLRAVPGGPFDQERNLPPEIEAKLMAAYDLDKPLWVQYQLYMARLVQGDLGPSFRHKDFTVAQLIARALPISAALGLCAITIAVLVGGALGVWAALSQSTGWDYAVLGFSAVGLVIPRFVLAPLLVLVLSVQLGLLPVAGLGDWRNLVLPIVCLAIPSIAFMARLTRAGMIESLRTNYVRTARAKGMPERSVVLRHALKPALLPVLSYLGPAIAGILTGSVVVEQIFDIPGMGRYLVQGALDRDYTLVMGVVIVYSVLIVTLNLVVDLMYGVLDPRVRQR